MSLDFYDLVINIPATGARGRHPLFTFWIQGECCAGGTQTQSLSPEYQTQVFV